MRLGWFGIALVAPALLGAQSNLGSIDGKVVNSATGEPVKRAVINITDSGRNYSAVTDGLGKFHIDGVQPGQCFVAAQAEGFTPPNRVKPFTVDASGQAPALQLDLVPLSVISGKVLDDAGEPIEGANVNAARYNYANGGKTLQVMNGAQTNDRGEYRMFDLQPGRYYVAVTVPNRQSRPNAARQPHVHSDIPEEGYAETFYPGAAEAAQATAHNLKAGEDWTGVDFKLRKQSMYHVRGSMDLSALPEGSHANVQLAKCEDERQGFMGGAAFLNNPQSPTTFDIAAVPGSYCLLVREQTRGGGIAMHYPVTIKDGDVGPIKLTPPAPFTVRGMVSFDGAPPDHMPRLGIGLRSADGMQLHSNIGDDLTFQIENVFPGKYWLVLPSPGLAYAKSVTYGSQDVSNGIIPDLEPGASLSVAMATDAGSINGTVQPGSLEAGAPVLVTAVQAGDSARDDALRINNTSVGGTFTLGALAPGEYKVFALESMNYEDVQNRDLLNLLAGQAASVTIQPNGHETVTVTPIAAADIERALEKMQ